jgi:hypothetical protein
MASFPWLSTFGHAGESILDGQEKMDEITDPFRKEW